MKSLVSLWSLLRSLFPPLTLSLPPTACCPAAMSLPSSSSTSSSWLLPHSRRRRIAVQSAAASPIITPITLTPPQLLFTNHQGFRLSPIHHAFSSPSLAANHRREFPAGAERRRGQIWPLVVGLFANDGGPTVGSVGGGSSCLQGCGSAFISSGDPEFSVEYRSGSRALITKNCKKFYFFGVQKLQFTYR
jgi:hypothetical protein